MIYVTIPVLSVVTLIVGIVIGYLIGEGYYRLW